MSDYNIEGCEELTDRQIEGLTKLYQVLREYDIEIRSTDDRIYCFELEINLNSDVCNYANLCINDEAENYFPLNYDAVGSIVEHHDPELRDIRIKERVEEEERQRLLNEQMEIDMLKVLLEKYPNYKVNLRSYD